MDEDFKLFWECYPRKIAKAETKKAWAQTKHIRPDVSILVMAVKAQSKTEQWIKGGGQFIPYPATWLRGERWEDEIQISLPDVVNEKLWHETSTGIEAKGRELGLNPVNFEHFPAFRAAVMRACMKAA